MAFSATIFTLSATANPYILVDANSGDVLAQNLPDHRWYPASLTKLMTAYVTFRAIKNNELKAGSPVVISKLASSQPPGKMGYKAGTRIRIDTALKIIIIKSANDVSLALAEAVTGNVPDFVSRMNDEAARLGMVNTYFVNTNGLHHKNQYTSARDMARLSVEITREFPAYRELFAAAAVKTAKKVHYSYNLLLERYLGTDGMKTGFVCASGYNMVASANRSGERLVAVVMGRSSQSDRAIFAAKLLSDGFAGSISPVGNILIENTPQGATAKNMRSSLCSQKARKARYDPGAGKAVIKSEYLLKRQKSDRILSISVGGIDADPSEAYLTRASRPTGKVPVPLRRPSYVVVNVDGIRISSSLSLRGTFPVPVRRPQ